MNKSELIVWLADHLYTWPLSLQSLDSIEGYEWRRSHNSAIILAGTNGEYVEKSDWMDECMNTTPIEPKPPVAVEAMLDIETFDTTNDAVVFQVAIVMFNRQHTVMYRETWDLNIDEQMKIGRTVSGSTLAFHLKIPKNALTALTDSDAVHVKHFADDLVRVISMHNPKAIWTKGSFDFNILESLLRSVGVKQPWEYYQCRELRTLMKECGIAKGNVSHTALEDCVAQITALARCRHTIATIVDRPLKNVKYDVPA